MPPSTITQDREASAIMGPWRSSTPMRRQRRREQSQRTCWRWLVLALLTPFDDRTVMPVKAFTIGSVNSPSATVAPLYTVPPSNDQSSPAPLWHRKNSDSRSTAPGVGGDTKTIKGSSRGDCMQSKSRASIDDKSGSKIRISIPKNQIPTVEDEDVEFSPESQRQQPYRHHRHNHNNFQQKQGSNRKLYQKYKPRRPSQRLSRERHHQLLAATRTLLDLPTGFLVNGKHHELISMFHAWSKYAKETSDAPRYMEKIVQRLSEEKNSENSVAHFTLGIDMYNMILDAWACVALFVQTQRQSEPHGAQRCREILAHLQSHSEAHPELRPNEKSFYIVLHVVCRTEGLVKARRVLAWMEYLHKTGSNPNAKPSRKQYVQLLNAYAYSREPNAGNLAHAFLRHMHSIGEEPNTICCNIAIKAVVKARRGRESAEQAEQILEEMEAPKDSFTYSSVISAWAASGMRSHAVSRAEKLLRAMEEVDGLEPNAVVLNTVMLTWIKSKSVGAVNRTQAILARMEEADSRGRALMKPDLISYNNHLHSLSLHSSFDESYAARAHDLLLNLEKRAEAQEISFAPNLFSYNLCIEAWSKSKDPRAALRAVEMLRKLIRHDNLEPDTFSFNCAITALSRSKSPSAACIAEELLQYMEDAYDHKIHRKVRPDVLSYTTTIVALSHCSDPDAPERAEMLLERMKARHAAGEAYLKPNLQTLNSLINCWANSGRGTLAARRAEAVLHEMDEMRKLGDDISPSTVTFNSLINSWAKSGTLCAGNKAESYLNRMWQLYEAGSADVKPNDRSFNTVINAISRSRHQSKAQKALRVLRRMDKLYQAGYVEAKPCTISYTSVINACALPASLDDQTRRKAFDTAIFTMEELRSSKYGKPNQITYAVFLKACGVLLSSTDDDLRRSTIEKTFLDCCKEGLVDDTVLVQLRHAAPSDLYQQLLADAVIKSHALDNHAISARDLPSEWRCNLRT